MSLQYPNFSEKQKEKAIFAPSDYVNYLKKMGLFPQCPIPETVILTFQPSLMNYVGQKYQTTPGDRFFKKMMILDATNGKVGVMGKFGVGAPAAVIILEELIALGVKRFISIGSAGTLQKSVSIGDLILCSKAIRDEGTSHHYLSSEKYAHPTKELTKKIEKILIDSKTKYYFGSSWTIDTPYRETVAEAQRYQEEGVMTVEMEAAALFSVAQFRQVEIASLFAISDSLSEFIWHPDFYNPKTKSALEKLFEIAYRAASSEY